MKLRYSGGLRHPIGLRHWAGLLVPACAMAAPAASAELYRCVSDGGIVSYQDAPCGRGSTLSRTIAFAIDPEVQEERKPAKRKGISAKASRGANAGKARASASGDRARRRLACANARKQRDVAVERLGLKRTYEQLSALDRPVAEACKGL